MLPTIICIDDEAHNNEAIERLLRRKYTVLSTTQPSEGLALIKKHRPALIISDQRMPQMTGVELLKSSVDLSPESVRILLTGYTDLESVIGAINEGQIYRYITKPWDPTDLQLTIDKALETYDLRKEIQRQNEELKSLDRLKTEFMILVSHELRTPLAGISSFVELLKEELKSADHKLYVSHIEKNSGRLKKLIDDILTITRLKTEKSKISKQPVDLQPLIKSCWTAAEDKEKKLTLEIKGDKASVATHESFLKDVLVRLFTNCFQHSADKSKVTVEIKEGKSSVVIKVSNPSESDAVIETQDLLSAFTKNENIMNHTQGTGLGLAVVNALMQSLHGDLNIEARNKIFTVKLELPVRP